MARPNKMKRALHNGERVFGTWSVLGSYTVVNTLAHSGLDFVVLCVEHGPMGWETLEQQIMAAEVDGLTPIVRMGDSRDSHLLHALEIGAQCVMVSHVSTAEQADGIVKACLYYPEGTRGLAPFTRGHGYSDDDLTEKLADANREMFVGVLVEGEEGLANLEAIAQVPNLDMIYLGIYDISQSLGIPGQVDHPDVIKVVKDCVKIITDNGKIAGSVAKDRPYIDLLHKAGFTFIAYRIDNAVMREGFIEARSWFDELEG